MERKLIRVKKILDKNAAKPAGSTHFQTTHIDLMK